MTGILEFGKLVNSDRKGSGTGVVSWNLAISDEGHRVYSIVFRVRTDRTDLDEGPTVIANTAGLPRIGTPWLTQYWNLGADLDLWARRTPYMRVTPYKPDISGKAEFWDVECRFSTVPRTRCQDARIEDPLLEPQMVGGSFYSKLKEAKHDKDGDPIKSSSHEPVRGPAVEFDDMFPTVSVHQNVGFLNLPLVSQLCRKTVNKDEMWGLEARTVRLANAGWTRQVVGTCEYYYTRSFEFEIDYDTFDRDDIIDEGTKALGYWDPETKVWAVPAGYDEDDASHFSRYRDRDSGEIAHVLLDGSGRPLSGTADYAVIPMIADKGAVKYYKDEITVGGVSTDVDYIQLLGVPAIF